MANSGMERGASGCALIVQGWKRTGCALVVRAGNFTAGVTFLVLLLSCCRCVCAGGGGCAGLEASDFIARGVHVDVMLLDIRMPGKSGLDVVRDVANRPPYPIVAMTGHVDVEAQDEFRCVAHFAPTVLVLRLPASRAIWRMLTAQARGSHLPLMPQLVFYWRVLLL